MSEYENTKVRISFTVEMSEVPSRISGLVTEAVENLDEATQQARALASNLEEHKNIQHSYTEIDQIRRSMMKIDIRLEDCQRLLKSYQNAMAQVYSQGESAEEQPSEAVDVKEHE